MAKDAGGVEGGRRGRGRRRGRRRGRGSELADAEHVEEVVLFRAGGEEVHGRGGDGEAGYGPGAVPGEEERSPEAVAVEDGRRQGGDGKGVIGEAVPAVAVPQPGPEPAGDGQRHEGAVERAPHDPNHY